MSKTTFWGSKGSTRRRVGGLVNDKLVDFEVGHFGIRFIETVGNQATRWVPWAELHKVAQGAVPTDAAAEKSRPEDVEICYVPRSEWPPHIREFFEKWRESLHGPLNESAPLRILPVEDEP